MESAPTYEITLTQGQVVVLAYIIFLVLLLWIQSRQSGPPVLVVMKNREPAAGWNPVSE